MPCQNGRKAIASHKNCCFFLGISKYVISKRGLQLFIFYLFGPSPIELFKMYNRVP